MIKNTTEYYGSVAKFFHWLIATLVLCMLFAGYFMDDINNKPLRGEIINLHKLVGLAILLLVLFRLLWALLNKKPLLPAATPVWQRWAERIVHFSLYAVIIFMPIAGWIMAVASGHAPNLDGIRLFLPVPINKALSNAAFDVHSWLAIAIIALISVHALAAFYHHFIKKDNILRRMWWGH